MKKVADAMAALREIAEISRTYDSEYAGRMYTYCTACEATLSEGEDHHDGCAWALVDAVISDADNPQPAPEPEDDDSDYYAPGESGYSRADEEWFFDSDGKP